MAARKTVSKTAARSESRPLSPQSPALTTVMVLGFEGGSITVAHEPRNDEFWLRVYRMSMSFWDSELEDDAPPAEWTKGLSWEQVMARLRESNWWRREPMEVHADYRDRVRLELDKLRLSHGWQAWLEVPASPRTRRSTAKRSLR